MSNLILIYDEVSETKRVTRRTVIPGSSGCCPETQACEEITETSAPLDCEAGDKIILFFKNPLVTEDESGVIVGDIIRRTFLNGQYTYYVRYDDALLAPGVSPNTLTQCDVLSSCCYDCSAEYSDRPVQPPPPLPAIIADHMSFVELNPIGGNTLEHTAIDAGPTYLFQEGFSSVRAAAGGGNPGVDPNKMVRGITLSGTELIVDAAPEHTSLAGTPNFGYFAVVSVQAVGNVFSNESPLVIINNPSSDRSMKVSVAAHWFWKIRQFNGVRRLRFEIAIDGAPFIIINSAEGGPFNPTADVDLQGWRPFNFTLLPLGSVTYQLRMQMQTTVAGTGTEQGQNVSLFSSFIGVTI